MDLDENFNRVSPEAYNRLRHPSPKQYHDFMRWLRETTLAELEVGQGDIAATRAAFIRFFQRGMRAELLPAELMDILPSLIGRMDYAEPERSEVIAKLKALHLQDLGIRRDEKGLKPDGRDT
jgi:hypothetical protein